MTVADDLERHMLELINHERTSRDLDALVLELNLNVAADAHSQWMSDADTFSHTGVNGSSPTERMRDADMNLAGAWGTAENIAAVSLNANGSFLDEVERLHTNLMNSTGHRANILNPDMDFLGLGIVLGPLSYDTDSGEIVLDSMLVTQNFARTSGTVDLDLSGSGNAEAIDGSKGDDTISGGAGNDTLIANDGGDGVWGGGGSDTIDGGGGNDTLRGGREEDLIEGGSGNDVIRGQSNGDTVSGGDGNDNVKGGGGNDLVRGDGGDDFLKGGSRRDTVEGGSGNDMLLGNSFDDILDGGAGNDTLKAGGDDDRLIGGAGDDFLKGGSGADVFVFGTNHGRDRISDFDMAEDRLEISSGLAGGRSASDIAGLAELTGGGVTISLDAGDEILLEGLGSLDGLAAVIDIL